MTKRSPNPVFPKPSRTLPTIGFSFLLDPSIRSIYFDESRKLNALYDGNRLRCKEKITGPPFFIISL